MIRPTHVCSICGAFWKLWAESWSLVSKVCGECCDNVEMGDQIELLEEVDESGSIMLGTLLEMTVPAKDKDDNDIEITPEFRVAVQSANHESGGVHFIIHPVGHNGKTLDFTVKGNTLTKLF